MLTNALASATAGAVGRICTHPLDVAKARIQYQEPSSSVAHQSNNLRPRPYRGTVDVLQRTARTEGIKGLYRGFGAVIIGGVPATMIYLCSYDLAKERLLRLSGSNTENSGKHLFAVHFSAGMIAESISCIVFVPVDVIKERLQVQHPISSDNQAKTSLPNYRNSWDALKQISRQEGMIYIVIQCCLGIVLLFRSRSLFLYFVLKVSLVFIAATEPPWRRLVPFQLFTSFSLRT